MIVAPHEFVTVGGVGTVCASMIHATFAEPGAGKVNVGGEMIYVCVHCADDPVQSEYVQV